MLIDIGRIDNSVSPPLIEFRIGGVSLVEHLASIITGSVQIELCFVNHLFVTRIPYYSRDFDSFWDQCTSLATEFDHPTHVYKLPGCFYPRLRLPSFGVEFSNFSGEE